MTILATGKPFQTRLEFFLVRAKSEKENSLLKAWNLVYFALTMLNSTLPPALSINMGNCESKRLSELKLAEIISQAECFRIRIEGADMMHREHLTQKSKIHYLTGFSQTPL